MRMAFPLCAISAVAPAVAASVQISQDKATELRAELARTGSLRVIVTLSVDDRVNASAAARLSQEELLHALEGTEHQVVLVFPSTPLVALIAGADALEVLISHPLVASIMVDSARAPAATAR
jgi:hypothetical protein